MLDKLINIQNSIIKSVPFNFKRYLYNQIDWNSRSICITGTRGTGKTTLLLQYFKENYNDTEQCLYLSADNIEVAATGLYKIATEYFKFGGKAIIIDEIHKYPDWQIELKNIIDSFPDKKIIISGSSSLDLKKGKADLSRRLVYYDLKGLSFREYLQLKENIKYKPCSMNEILSNHAEISKEFTKNTPILKYFNKYLRYGYYPFIIEGEGVYLQKILNIIEKVFYEDIAVVGNLKRSNVQALKKILWIVATAVPFSVNIDKLSREIGISKEYVYSYISYLEDAGLLCGIFAQAKGFKLTRKPAKLFIENTNILEAINSSLRTESEKGTIRETFFVNQVKAYHKLSYSEVGDFLVEGKYVFEIGGKHKDFEQLGSKSNSFVASDGIESGFKNKIPLYLFGFLY
ncbi:MAG: hypothetical protein A2252_04150 [Elusimicrobia bacterium RIFOXYA2_FULL_39_19]|nr:MAG: hypothetical protein A2252_04150 [Elusimicrobia bacterium RIFOXYA2_FULL_39_19]